MSESALRVALRRLDRELPLPAYALPGDAGADLYAAVNVDLAPGERALVPTGLAIALPEGYAGFVHPRSGLAARCGMSLVNTPGTIDAGYRGEIKLIVINLDPRETVSLRRGDRVAQLVIQRVERVEFVEVAELPGSARGAAGHGSTGGWGARADSLSPSSPNPVSAGPVSSDSESSDPQMSSRGFSAAARGAMTASPVPDSTGTTANSPAGITTSAPAMSSAPATTSARAAGIAAAPTGNAVPAEERRPEGV